MRKIALVICLILGIVFLVRIIRILWNDFSRLTDYGFGYLAGSVILFLLFAIASYLLVRRLLKSKN